MVLLIQPHRQEIGRTTAAKCITLFPADASFRRQGYTSSKEQQWRSKELLPENEL